MCAKFHNYNEASIVEVNSHGVNKKIKSVVLSNKEMKKTGFTNYVEGQWYFYKNIRLPKKRKFSDTEISFNVTIYEDGSDIRIDILDEDFLQPYDYQYILACAPVSHPERELANVVKEQVEKWMKHLQNKGILSGHNYGEYI